MENPDCTSCHRGHKKTVLLCDECHEFRELKVP
ncbi:cytochrome c3 family protein [Turicimonas muris]|nr:cytochrome c3 family protein [Turicimonas muris]